jgi:hypothetical protein
MFINLRLTPRQKQGTIVCLPKHRKPTTPAEFRPITLLNTDYKLLPRIIANRLKQVLEDNISAFQYCGVRQNIIMDAVATIREATALTETTYAY